MNRKNTFEKVIIILNVLISFLLSILSSLKSVQEVNPSAGIYQSSMLGAYNFFLVLSGIISRPDLDEKLSSEPSKLVNYLSTFGFTLAIILIAFSAYRTGQASEKLSFSSSSASISDIKNESSKSKKETRKTKIVNDEEKQSHSEDKESQEEESDYNRSFFQLIFCLASFQLAVTMTKWQVLVSENGLLLVEDNQFAFYAKIITSFSITILYIFSLFAPLIFPERQF